MKIKCDLDLLSELGSFRNPSTSILQTLDAFVDIYTGCQTSGAQLRPWAQIKIYFGDPRRIHRFLTLNDRRSAPQNLEQKLVPRRLRASKHYDSVNLLSEWMWELVERTLVISDHTYEKFRSCELEGKAEQAVHEKAAELCLIPARVPKTKSPPRRLEELKNEEYSLHRLPPEVGHLQKSSEDADSESGDVADLQTD